MQYLYITLKYCIIKVYMQFVEPETYRRLGESLLPVAESWVPVDNQSKRNPGTLDRFHDVVGAAYRSTVRNDSGLPAEWERDKGVADAMEVFTALSFMKAATAGYSGQPKEQLAETVLSSDGLRYATKLAIGNSIIAGRTEFTFSLSNHHASYPGDYQVTSGNVMMIDGKLIIPTFDLVRLEHTDAAVEKGLAIDRQCPALLSRAFPIIYQAVNVLNIHSGTANDTYDRFADMK